MPDLELGELIFKDDGTTIKLERNGAGHLVLNLTGFGSTGFQKSRRAQVLNEELTYHPADIKEPARRSKAKVNAPSEAEDEGHGSTIEAIVAECANEWGDLFCEFETLVADNSDEIQDDENTAMEISEGPFHSHKAMPMH